MSDVPGVYYRQDDAIVYHPVAAWQTDYDSFPIPAYDLLPGLENYRPNVPTTGNFMIVYTSKGCPFSCSYCTVANSTFKIKSTEGIIEELSLLYEKYNVRLISIFDETFTLRKTRVIDLCKQIQERMPELRWYCNTRGNLVDEEILRAMREGGCRGVSFGVESGSQRILDGVKKGIRVEEASKAITAAKECGLKVFASFVFGLPGEDWDSVKETLRFVRSTLPHGAQFNVAVPYPGTGFYEYVKKENLLTDGTTWDDMFQHRAVARTKNLSQEELESIRKQAYKELYLNLEWFIQNVEWVLAHPEDMWMGIRYYSKALSNLLIYGMENAH
jgi:radical SAM superfamily enzyme YgiQ (UPF0313 family)